jgi:hypothetical protein
MKRIKLILVVFLFSILVFANVQNCFNQYMARLSQCRQLFGGDPEGLGACYDGAFLMLQHCLGNQILDSSSPLFGAKLPLMNFARAKGAPEVSYKTFSIETAGDYYFNLFNGDSSEISTRVSSATVIMEPGSTIFSQSDFNKQVFFLVKPVHLEAGNYTLRTELTGQPGSFFAIIVSDRDFSQFIE